MWHDVLEGPHGQVGKVTGGSHLAPLVGSALVDVGFRGTGLVVADRTLEGWLNPWKTSIAEAGLDAAWVLVAGGESSKSLQTVERLYDEAARAGVARDGFVVAIGGGALSDVVGFAAATYLRGVPWAVVPTTLLAQVDAALGGKTAIDLPQGKNLAGAFHLPRLVLEDTVWLDTLPAREWRSGFGEVLKTALLVGGSLWEEVQAAAPSPESRARFLSLLEPACRHKLRVVREDPREEGVRATLNLGHTVGHAYEAWSGFGGQLSHGEAVGVGLLGALFLSERVTGLDPAVRHTVRQLLDRWGMPLDLHGAPADALTAILRHDKKRQSGVLRWVLLEEVGRPIVRPVDADEVATMLRALGAA